MYQVLLLLVTALCAAQAGNNTIVDIKSAVQAGDTILDLALETPQLSTLVTALTAGGLVSTLEGPGPFTVFAPTNAAFDALPAGVLAKLLEEKNKAALDKVLLYHVLKVEVHSNQLVDGEMLQTLDEKYVTVTIDGRDVKINTAKITIADIQASNGVIHIIDAVLLPPLPPLPPSPPPSNTIVDEVLRISQLSTLVEALTAGGLVQTLKGDGLFTVFAPTNAAFDALPAGVLALLLEQKNKAELDKLLLYHVLGAEVHSNQLVDGSKLQTLEKDYVTVTIDGRDVKINTAKVTIADVQASNGVIHIIDAVLLPSASAAFVGNGSASARSSCASCGSRECCTAPCHWHHGEFYEHCE